MARFRRKRNRPMRRQVAQRDSAGHKRVYLSEWKNRARAREVKLAEALQGRQLGPPEIQKLQTWLQNLEARRLWLEARLEHIKAFESILKSACGLSPPCE